VRITATELGVASGKTEILKGINVRFEHGQFIGILGPSGSGKSTLLTALSGRRAFNSGEVLYDGHPLSGRAGQTIGFVPQDDTLHLALTTRRLLTYAARLQLPGQSEAELKAIVDATLSSVGLQERAKLPVYRLSGGQRKRVSIALELLFSPQALFLDEPTSGLDPELEKSVMSLCSRLAQEGRVVIMTTHILESIDLFDRLLFLVAGEMAFFGTPSEARTFFKVADIHHVYPLLSRSDSSKLPGLYRASSYYETYKTR
jgi:ABC-type multidrug transport system ATPase subunit